jgi:hypothetical protein
MKTIQKFTLILYYMFVILIRMVLAFFYLPIIIFYDIDITCSSPLENKKLLKLWYWWNELIVDLEIRLNNL